MVNIVEKIKEIQDEMARTQKNKATEYHLGLLKGKLAKYRRMLLEPEPGSSSAKGIGFEVAKSGDARVCLIGYPSVGKSCFLSQVTKTKSETAAYEFTTLTCVPGVLDYEGAEIQIVDLPGIIKGASEGRGRGRQVVATAKTADLVLMVLDATKFSQQRQNLERELESIGIRLNKQPPNMAIKVKTSGGIKLNSLNPPKYLDEKMVSNILKDNKIHNADVMIRDENVTVDDFVDVINEKGIAYIPCLYAYNKIDAVSLEEVDRIARQPNTVVMSCELSLGIHDVVEEIWYRLNLIRMYTKRRGEPPDFGDPMVVRAGSTIQDVCNSIHKDFKDQFKYALVWGSSSKFGVAPQKCGLSHKVHDQDVVTIVAK
ncbi:Ribosome-interacting GTPase 2 [Brettanomyces nanus]|uniref:Ribosome-interacting GTPase 2 n=1 Tax=Eeniella nana TaxID=13502 RepID=A0A875RZ20_EENNA|nr:Ribosome-interacting GTPase 2 [Brettanomyces nanus]QPG74406.1 Ribosome-interacting GTPase 2 [Brettanomyces nanus]